MKKRTLSLIAAVCLLCLTGCGSQIEQDIAGSTASSETGMTELEPLQFSMDFAPGRTDISECRSQYESEIKALQESNYDNVSFQDCTFLPLGNVEKVGVYRGYYKGIGVDESIGIVKDWLNDIGCEDIDLETELRDVSGQYELDDSKEAPYCYVSVFEHYPDFDSGGGFVINTNRCAIQMGSGGIYSMSDGSITEDLNTGKRAGGDAQGAFLGLNNEKVIETGLVSEKNDEVWSLVDGECSIGDAAKMVEDYFEAGTPYPPMEGMSVDVPKVAVFELNDKYGYAFQIRRVYNGVPFAYANYGGRTYYSSKYKYINEDIKHVYVINHDTVAAYIGYNESMQLESLIDEQTDILSCQDAASVLSDYLAGKVKLEVEKVELVYCPCYYTEEQRIVHPCWQFEGMCTTNDQMMRAYVNVLSGDVYYYTFNEDII